MKRGLFIGRFQPFHLSHLAVVEEMQEAADLDCLVIGIGSAQYAHEKMNPFSAAEREQMLRASIAPVKLMEIVHLEDQHDNDRWVQYLASKIPLCHVAYTGNPLVHRLLQKQGYEVRMPQAHHAMRATVIRDLMASDVCWESYVPEGTKRVLQALHGAERVQKIYQQLLVIP